MQTEIACKRELIHSLLHLHSNSIIAKGKGVILSLLFIQMERVYFCKYFETFFFETFLFFLTFCVKIYELNSVNQRIFQTHRSMVIKLSIHFPRLREERFENG
jgi:hypothetical protein